MLLGRSTPIRCSQDAFSGGGEVGLVARDADVKLAVLRRDAGEQRFLLRHAVDHANAAAGIDLRGCTTGVIGRDVGSLPERRLARVLGKLNAAVALGRDRLDHRLDQFLHGNVVALGILR
jgi:hypothetical protein